MKQVDFETAFEEFLDRREYDKAENALFSMIRIAFKAGWMAASGSPPMSQPVIQLVHREVSDLDAEQAMKAFE